MKALLVIAVIALAANAHLSTPAYHLGFSERLGLDSEQLQHASTCFNSFKQIITDVRLASYSKKEGYAAVIRSLITLIEDFDQKFKVDCGVYMQDLFRVILRNTNGDIKGTAQRNFDLYTAEIVQAVAYYFEALAHGNHYEAGRIEAYILQVIFGLEQPRTYPAPQFNSSKYVPMNFTKYAFEFTEGYYKKLGFNDSKVISDNAECTITYVNFATSLQLLSHNMANAQDIYEKTKLIENLIIEAIKLYDTCLPAFSFNWEHISLPILTAFQHAPVHTVLTIVHNIAKNLPEIKQSHIEMFMKIYEGEYFRAGSINAELVINILKNLYF